MVILLNSVAMAEFFLNKLWYALNAKYYAKAPSHILERGKGVEEIASSFLLFKKKKEGKFWKYLDVYALEIKRESSLMLSGLA